MSNFSMRRSDLGRGLFHAAKSQLPNPYKISKLGGGGKGTGYW